MAKSPDAFRTISEVADWLDTQAHVLRFWESKFPQVKPVKRAGGRRYYRPADMLLLGGIKHLLHDEGMTIKGAQKLLREQGVKHVSGLSQPLDDDDDAVVPAKAAPDTDAAEQAPDQTVTDLAAAEVPKPADITADASPETPDIVAVDATPEADVAPAKDADQVPPESDALPAFLQQPSFDMSDLDEDDEVAAEVASDSVSEPPATAPEEDSAESTPDATTEVATDTAADDPVTDSTDTSPAPAPLAAPSHEATGDSGRDHPAGPLDSLLSALMKHRAIPAEHREAARQAMTRLEALAARLNESAEG
ncbi:MerR family transcriptional regulator [Shimia biformata]|uniref:MerR family transcriptional regulator n=1 Tax=Shimia biformata TaxID=1294299 RepID=UPI001EF1EC4B|nr:MerR family transcriptional regulator [Shimia biformata]